jgi:hypothetical protein
MMQSRILRITWKVMWIRLEKNYLQRSPVRNEHGQKAEYKRTIICCDFYLPHFQFLLKIILLSCIILNMFQTLWKWYSLLFKTKNRWLKKHGCVKWYGTVLLKKPEARSELSKILDPNPQDCIMTRFTYGLVIFVWSPLDCILVNSFLFICIVRITPGCDTLLLVVLGTILR